MIHPKSIKILIPEGSGKPGSKYAGVVEKLKKLKDQITISIIYISIQSNDAIPVILFCRYGIEDYMHVGDIDRERIKEILGGY